MVAGAALAKAAGFENVITCDLGGTSFDVCVVANGKAAVAAQTTVDFGLVIRTPMIEITTIGAGGGSLAWLDRSGLLQVGPQSAGSSPGPACYGQGNTQPTLTDAQVVLGRINASRPLGGELRSLDVEAAERAIAPCTSRRPLVLEPRRPRTRSSVSPRRAWPARSGWCRSNGGMIQPASRQCPLAAAAHLHIGALIRQIGLKCAIVPRFPGLTSALGCVIADPKHDVVQTVNLMLDGLDGAALTQRMHAAATAAGKVIAAAQIPVERVDVLYELDMHYLGQTHTVAVPLALRAADDRLEVTEGAVRAAFEAAYSTAFSQLLPGLPVRIASLRITAIGRRPAFDATVFAPDPGLSLPKAAMGSRRVWFDGRWRETSVWSRLDLPAGIEMQGPAVLEQPDGTVLIEPGLILRTDSLGNVMVKVLRH